MLERKMHAMCPCERRQVSLFSVKDGLMQMPIVAQLAVSYSNLAPFLALIQVECLGLQDITAAARQLLNELRH